MKFIRDKNICNLPKIYNLTQKNVLSESSGLRISRVHLKEMEDFNDTGITQAVQTYNTLFFKSDKTANVKRYYF